MGIATTGAGEAARAMAGRADRTADLRPALARIRDALQSVIDGTFAADAGPDGRAWAPRAAAVRSSNGRPARARTETRPGRALLEDTGALRASISVTVSGGTVSGVASAPYAAHHQRGTRWMPARKILPSTSDSSGPGADFFSSVARVVADHIAGRA